MRRLHLIENLKVFVYTQPPAVVFLLCLFSFIIVLSSFNGYISEHNVDNPDEMDWNVFRERIASLEYCVKYPEKPDLTESAVKSGSKLIHHDNVETYQYDLTFNLNYNGNVTRLLDLEFLGGAVDGFLIGLEKSI